MKNLPNLKPSFETALNGSLHPRLAQGLPTALVALGFVFMVVACGDDAGNVAASAASVGAEADDAPTTSTERTSTAPTSTARTSTAQTSTTRTSTTAISTTVAPAATTAVSVSVESSPVPQESLSDEPADTSSTTTVAEPVTTTATIAEPATTAPTISEPVEVAVPEPAGARVPEGQAWTPFASFAGVTLVHPSVRVERIGFHESNNDGARQMEPADTAVAPLVLESRGRGTGSRTAADIVVEPGTEIRAPVTGTVLRAGGYILYCDHRDDFAVIEPDAHPGWEVKVLHIDGVLVTAGDRVEAGVTVLAPAATQLPFDSQVDEFTGRPAWPHVHIELVDPSIPDRPSVGGGC